MAKAPAKKKKTSKKWKPLSWLDEIELDKKKNPRDYHFKTLYLALEDLHEMTSSADMEAVPTVELEFYAGTLMNMAVGLKFRLDDLTGPKVRCKV